jgi:nucleolar protein 58
MTGAGHKSGHAANVAEAHRKAELAREQEELLSSRKGKGRGEDELDAREVKLLDELRRSLTPQALLGKGVGALASTSGKSNDTNATRAKGIVTTAIPNRKSMLKSAEVVHAEKEKKEKKKKKKKRDREEEDEDEDEERKEAKETTKTKTYLSRAERKRLKKKKQQQL